MTCKTVKEKESLTGATVPMGGQAAAYLWAARRLPPVTISVHPGTERG